MAATYDQDVVAWAVEQAALLRAGRLTELDLEHIADEIDGVARAQGWAFTERVAALLVSVIAWQRQPDRRGERSRRELATRRKDAAYLLSEAPSLRTKFNDAAWLDLVWAKATLTAANETGLDAFPDACPWSMEQALDEANWPS